MSAIPNDEPQTPAQWAVRWHGLVLGALLIFSVPVVHLGWHSVMGHDQPPVLTRSQVAKPVPTWDTVRDGSWMLREERYLREASPIVWWLRSSWNELRYRTGVPQSDQVHFGAEDWFYITQEVVPDVAAFTNGQSVRRRFFGEVRDLVKRAGAELFVMVIPDKARVYPEKAYEGGVISAAKAPVYPAILADLEAEGIATLDVAAAMAAARAADPTTELYYRRDTHWRPQGALVGGQAAAAAIERRFGALLSPRRAMELGGVTGVRLIGDLTANFGIGTIEVPDGRGGMNTIAMSLLAESLAETREYYGVTVRDGERSLPMYGDDPAAEILVIGTSFSEENGMKALSLSLGRPVRAIIARGAPGLLPLQAAKAELLQGTRAKVVVWELVERGFCDPAWQDPKL